MKKICSYYRQCGIFIRTLSKIVCIYQIIIKFSICAVSIFQREIRPVVRLQFYTKLQCYEIMFYVRIKNSFVFDLRMGSQSTRINSHITGE